MDVGDLVNDGVITDAVLLLDESLGKAILAVGGVRFVGGYLHLGDEQPLDESESYADQGADRDDNLGAEI